MVDIVLCADEAYIPYAAVVMASAVQASATPQALRFHLLTTGISEESERRLHGMLAPSGAQLNVVPVQADFAAGLALGRFGAASLLRLMMPRFLPEGCRRAIYLDCDVMVVDDLATLWETDLEGHAVGAVMDLCGPTVAEWKHDFASYFNSGVLLVDLERWQRDEIEEQALAFLRHQQQPLDCPDQDALNDAIGDAWARLHPRWNFQPTAYPSVEKPYPHMGEFNPGLREAIASPAVIHFIGPVKPWHAMSPHPLKHLFTDCSLLTPWPIDARALHQALPLKKRLRLKAKAHKLRRRRQMSRI
ncbi:Lipopolysaccharide biosynthesis protein, LPS:glycosyltransferase [Franzmannia pantelleriensis]|uniref:Lipopolysaccharide biosynthesis protein, LPS:glycosyltransferase n=1 Tax=Franzmannia pantelleriensis TaxID=48727 RepID=A0A1G9EEP8_9GAMM|nr:glycosyltransferase family 8 protein [Halomonas pantelleriensis]SDK74586.1 Lipopolysaccharide biosynthesis protein, LPS:glycosyltransferase [Halomonas pantelleriensis]